MRPSFFVNRLLRVKRSATAARRDALSPLQISLSLSDVIGYGYTITKFRHTVLFSCACGGSV